MSPQPKKLQVLVVVAGGSNSGKTTVAHLIEQKLREVGVEDVNVIDDEVMPERFNLERNLAALKATGLSVTINTRQTYRHEEYITIGIDQEES